MTVKLLVLLISLATFAFAGGETTPEIDASTAVGGVTLVSGGLLVLRARRRKN